MRIAGKMVGALPELTPRVFGAIPVRSLTADKTRRVQLRRRSFGASRLRQTCWANSSTLIDIRDLERPGRGFGPLVGYSESSLRLRVDSRRWVLPDGGRASSRCRDGGAAIDRPSATRRR